MNGIGLGSRLNGTPSWVLPAVAVGAAVGIAIAATRRKKSRWDIARETAERVLDRRQDLAGIGKDLAGRFQTIYREGRAAAGEVSELWGHGRKMLRSGS